MTSDQIYQQSLLTFKNHAGSGIKALKLQQPDFSPVLSHICFKFTDMTSYQEAIEAAKELGTVSNEQFNGKEISWCKLDNPIKSDDLTLEWLEMVEPKIEKNAFNGITSIGYYVPELADVVKIQSIDEAILYRYQPFSVHP